MDFNKIIEKAAEKLTPNGAVVYLNQSLGMASKAEYFDGWKSSEIWKTSDLSAKKRILAHHISFEIVKTISKDMDILG